MASDNDNSTRDEVTRSKREELEAQNLLNLRTAQIAVIFVAGYIVWGVLRAIGVI